MSKAFKSVRNSGRTLDVKGDAGDGSINLLLMDLDSPRLGIALSRTEAPELALAILEASGVNPRRTDTYTVGEPDNLQHIAANLQHHIEVRDRAAKEAAEHAELVRRRDDLASAFADCALEFNDVHVTVQRAIDYIIELEDRATK